MGLDRRVQRLIDVMWNRSESPAQTPNLLMRIERIGIECVPDSKSPRQLLRHFPGVLRIQVEIQKIEGFVRRRRKSFRRRRSDSVNILWQRGVRDRRYRALSKIVVVQSKNPRIGSEAQFVRSVAPREVVVDEETRGFSSLNPRVVQSSQCREWRIRAAPLQHDGQRGQRLLKIRWAEQTRVPGKCRIEIIHEVLRKHVRISGGERVKRLWRDGVEQRV